MKYTSNLLKIALFATGLAGIVSEYTLSTLATYFLGDSVFQWTMIVSVMLFSMGFGSRLSKYIDRNVLEKFVWIEFVLSCIASNVTVIVYAWFAFYGDTTFIIYFLAIAIGILIGMEIPLVIRLNEEFQNLRVNISSAMEKDYYGSLAGGLFFAFIGLPYLGLTYTPLILGGVNFIVAIILLYVVWGEIPTDRKSRFVGYVAAVVIMLGLTAMYSRNIVEWGDRIRYKDNVVYSEQSRYQKIVLTYSKGDYWLFLDGHQQLSTLDEVLYHEPLVHPVMTLSEEPKEVLVLGGGDGAAVREILKYPIVEQVTLVDLDPAVTELAKTHAVLTEINHYSLVDPKVTVINMDGFTYLADLNKRFDVIIADFPDPRSVDLGRLYTLEFYQLCKRALTANGYLITQAGSPYYAERAFRCIEETMKAAGFNTLPLHNQVLTLGEWGWVIGARGKHENLKEKLQKSELSGDVELQWLNQDALVMLTSFGKQVLKETAKAVEINRLHNPKLYKYYANGRWDIY